MAYPAVMCLKNTIMHLVTSPRISIQYTNCVALLKGTFIASEQLRDAILKNDANRKNIISMSERMMGLEAEVREAASKLEDSIESQVAAQILSQYDRGDRTTSQTFSIDLREIHDQLGSFPLMAERMAAAYLQGDREAVVSPPIYFEGGDPSKIVGYADKHEEITALVTFGHHRDLFISGMAGLGKTTAVKKVLEDPRIKRRFKRCIFVPVGLEPQVNSDSQFKRILQAILAQVKPDSDAALMAEVVKLDESFWGRLIDKETLIVLDDLWNRFIWNRLRRILPEKSNGCTILATTRTKRIESYERLNIDMRFMNNEESWDLLRVRVFGETRVPDELEKAGKKIAENCEGLPLLIIAVADLLSTAERTPEFWDMVAAGKENHIFVDAYEQISEVLLPSYLNLRLEVKPCYLYFRVFPQNYQIRRSRFAKLFRSEDFLRSYSKYYIKSCLDDFKCENVMLVHCQSEWHGEKIYSLHSGFWHLCKKQAENIKILYTFNRYADGMRESIEGQRRLAIYKNVLLGIEHIYNSVASVPNARSLLCTGPYHQYQVPICFSKLRLLRVLDALSIRFYLFPKEVLQLITLRYLALTCNGNISPSIRDLWNLQCLIVQKHLSIKSTLAESYLPSEIWCLQELKYLEIMGRNLPDPPPGVCLPKLSKLLGVDAHSFTKDVLQSFPKLKKLRVEIELTPDAAECLTCFDHLSHMPKLKSFQCIIQNPKIIAPPPRLSISGSCLQKLTLRGFGYPWHEMNKIAGLPSLLVLKLQCYAFRGPDWKVKKAFQKLDTLHVEDTDLRRWTSNGRIGDLFPSLRFLSFKDCYKLKNIPEIWTLKEIKLVDCNPAVVVCPIYTDIASIVSASFSWE